MVPSFTLILYFDVLKTRHIFSKLALFTNALYHVLIDNEMLFKVLADTAYCNYLKPDLKRSC